MKLREGATLTKLQQYCNRIREVLHGEVINSLYFGVFPMRMNFVETV